MQNKSMTTSEFAAYVEATAANVDACERLCGTLSNSDKDSIALQVARMQAKIRDFPFQQWKKEQSR